MNTGSKIICVYFHNIKLLQSPLIFLIHINDWTVKAYIPSIIDIRSDVTELIGYLNKHSQTFTHYYISVIIYRSLYWHYKSCHVVKWKNVCIQLVPSSNTGWTKTTAVSTLIEGSYDAKFTANCDVIEGQLWRRAFDVKYSEMRNRWHRFNGTLTTI